MASRPPNAAAETGISIGSLLLSHHRSSPSHFRLWTSSFGRVISDVLSCGGSSFRWTPGVDEESEDPSLPPPDPVKTTKSDKLSDLLSIADAECEEETKRKQEAFERMESGVRDLQFHENAPDWTRIGQAARRVRLVAKEDSDARATLAMLGAIPPLVSMLGFGVLQNDAAPHCQILVDALYSLLNIAIGNDANKVAIVKAGAVHKMLTLAAERISVAASEAIVANFLNLSASDSNKEIIGSSGAVPYLVSFVKTNCSPQAKLDAFKALYNLSIHSPNIPILIDADFIPYLMNTIGDMEVSERVLLILGNVVQTPEGRKAISSVRDAFPILVDVLNWSDSPACQESVSYILMVMAYKAYGDRQAMIDAGVASALLEVTLLGSTLAQKRASRILECLRVDKGKHVSENCMSLNVSAPISGSSGAYGTDADEEMLSEENKAVKQLVQQSLQSNMKRIVKRANLEHELGFNPTDHLKPLTSKSLPF